MATVVAYPQSRLRLSLTCISIVANSLVAGGVFVFPALSPTLASILKLSQPQLTTIAMAGIVGQYPFSPLVGRILDVFGPSTCSFISSVLFFVAFLSSAHLIEVATVDDSQSTSQSFHLLTFFFLMAGLATVFSYFSFIFAASKNFPHHPGAATGISMALFGLSPLCLSFVASRYFTEAASGHLRVVPYLRFLALLTSMTHCFGAFTLDSTNAAVVYEPEASLPDETTRLLTPKPHDGVVANIYPNPIRDRYFWILGLYCLCSIGATEMVMSNMGTIVLSLPPDSSSPSIDSTSVDIITANQVKIISISNTLSRLLVGPLADFVSPVASYLPTGDPVYPRKHRASRVVFLACPTLLLALTFFWMEVGVGTRDAVWALSVGAGINYGVAFTVLPSIVSSGWGPPDLGRNFGIMTYAPFIGTPLFSYLYAFISAANTHETTGICEGIVCWRTTFWIACVTSICAFLITLVLWKHWHGRI